MGSGGAAWGAAAGASAGGCWAWAAACLLAMCPPTTAAVPTTAVVRTAIRAIGRLLNMSNLLYRCGSDCRRQIGEQGGDQFVGHTGALEQYSVRPAHSLGEGG